MAALVANTPVTITLTAGQKLGIKDAAGTYIVGPAVGSSRPTVEELLDQLGTWIGPVPVDTSVTIRPTSAGLTVVYDADNGFTRQPATFDQTTGAFIAGTTSVYPMTSMTWAALSLLDPAANADRTVRVTDLNGAVFQSNGVRWKPMGGFAVIGTLDADWTGVTGTAEQIAYQRTIPAGLLKNGDALRVYGGFGKSGTAETATIQIRIGAAGTTADTSIITTAPLATTNISHGMMLEFRRNSATSVQRALSGATQNPLGATTSARGSATTLASSLDSVNQFITFTMTQSSTAETPSAWGIRIELISSGA